MPKEPTTEMLVSSLRSMARNRDRVTHLQRRALLAGAQALTYVERYLRNVEGETEEEAAESVDAIVDAIKAVMGGLAAVELSVWIRWEDKDPERIASEVMPGAATTAIWMGSRVAHDKILTGLANGASLIFAATRVRP